MTSPFLRIRNGSLSIREGATLRRKEDLRGASLKGSVFRRSLTRENAEDGHITGIRFSLS